MSASSTPVEVLFVDDEPMVLAGIQRAATAMEHIWRSRFAASGEEALARLAERPADVVVSDLQMPGMDGASLLAEVAERQPHALRVVLTGGGAWAAAHRGLCIAHQLLGKPCDMRSLRVLVQRALDGREALTPQGLELLGGRFALPARAETVACLRDAIEQGDANVGSVAAIVSGDLGATTCVLRMINVGFVGMPRVVSSVAEATALLGVDAIASALLADHGCSPGLPVPAWLDTARLAERGHRTAGVAKQLADLEGLSEEESDELSLAGLLHDVGLLVLARAADAAGASDEVADAGIGDLDGERARYGADRYTLGSHVLARWGFPPSVYGAIRSLGDPAATDHPHGARLRLVQKAMRDLEAQETAANEPALFAPGVPRHLVSPYLDVGLPVGRWVS